jgi:hypothetical protein
MRRAGTPWVAVASVPQYAAGRRAGLPALARPIPAALRRPTFVIGCCRQDHEGGSVSIDYLKQQLGDNEKIVYTERHHWIFPIAEMIKWIFFAVAVLVVIVLLKSWQPGWSWVNWLFIVFVVPAFRIVWGFISWRMNVYALTNRRVVEVTGVVNKTVADSSLEKLTDVVLRQGLFGRLLGYGDIEVLTAAAGAGINYLKQIRKPMQFKQAMVNAKEDLEHEMGQSR